jgi:manganese efflux pump family protein
MNQILAIVLVGISVGFGNFAASVAIGLGGVSKNLRLRIAFIFGLFETIMPIIGLIIGQSIAKALGSKANLIGGILLFLTGLYIIVSSTKKDQDKKLNQAKHSWTSLIIAGFSLSLDNLIVGFSLGTYKVNLVEAVIVIGVISVVMSLIGLELGNKLNKGVEKYSEILSGSILILVSILIGLNIL